MKLPAIIDKYRDDIDLELKSTFNGHTSPMYDMLRYHLGWIDEHGTPVEGHSGKALRPTLCLLCCEAAGGERQVALPAAAAIELLHNYSLIHDDIQDGDLQRRHRPTVWAVWGMPQSVNAGTAMRVLSNQALYHLETLGINAEKRLRVQQLIDKASLDLLEGQYLDIAFEEQPDITVAEYLEMIGGKTAALIACSLEVGALLGSDGNRDNSDYRELGWNLGLSFQIQDDVLGIWGTNELGKPLASDIRRRKKTLPVVHALEHACDENRETMVRYCRAAEVGEDDVTAILKVLDDTGARSYARAMNETYINKARDILGRMQMDTAYRKDFTELIDFLEARTY